MKFVTHEIELKASLTEITIKQYGTLKNTEIQRTGLQKTQYILEKL